MASGVVSGLLGAPHSIADAVPTFALAWIDPEGRLTTSVSGDARRWSPPRRHAAAIRSRNGPALAFDGSGGWRVFWFTPGRGAIASSQAIGNAASRLRLGPVRLHAIPQHHRPLAAPTVRPAVAHDGRRWTLAYRNHRPGSITIARSGADDAAPWTYRTLSGAGGWITPPALAYGNGALLLAYTVAAPGQAAPTGYQIRIRRSADGLTWSPAVTPKHMIGGAGSKPPLYVAPVQGPALAFAGDSFLLAATGRRDPSAPRFLYRYLVFGSADGARWRKRSGDLGIWSTTRVAVGMATTATDGCLAVAVTSSRPSGGAAARNIHIRRGTAPEPCGRASGIRWAHPNAAFATRAMLDRFVAVAYGAARSP